MDIAVLNIYFGKSSVTGYCSFQDSIYIFSFRIWKISQNDTNRLHRQHGRSLWPLPWIQLHLFCWDYLLVHYTAGKKLGEKKLMKKISISPSCTTNITISTTFFQSYFAQGWTVSNFDKNWPRCKFCYLKKGVFKLCCTTTNKSLLIDRSFFLYWIIIDKLDKLNWVFGLQYSLLNTTELSQGGNTGYGGGDLVIPN